MQLVTCPVLLLVQNHITISSPKPNWARRRTGHWIAFGQISSRKGRQDVASKLGRRWNDLDFQSTF